MATCLGPGRVRFAQFEFDRATGELYREGTRIRLQEQPAQILSALLEQPGDIVTRDRLRERLWSADTFVDYEHGLNTAVKKLRQALGDSAEAPAFIETLARRGYRFIGQAETLAITDTAALPVPEASAIPAPPAPGRRWQRTSAGAVVVALVALGAGVAWRTGTRGPTPVTSDAGRMPTTQLAVIPFHVLTEDREEASYLGTGLADAITTRLAGTRRIGVRPTAAALPFSNPSAPPAAVAASLGVEHLVVGTVQLSEQAYRVTVQLVRADGVAVWGHTYAEPRSALLDLQDRVAEQVVAALRIELAGPDRARLHTRYTDNAAAYDLYLRGRSLLVNYTEANMRAAITQFEQALALDPKYRVGPLGHRERVCMVQCPVHTRGRSHRVGQAGGCRGPAGARGGRLAGRRPPGDRERGRHGVRRLRVEHRAGSQRRRAGPGPLTGSRSPGPHARLLPSRPVRGSHARG